MKFRPCIDIHNGKVKQIVGGSLSDYKDQAKENFVSEQNAAFYGKLYCDHQLSGGHIILLNKEGSQYYEQDLEQAALALKSFPDGLQIGGGVNDNNAKRFLSLGATHVIVTSYVFRDGRIYYENLKKLIDIVGKEHLVLDLSCRKKDGDYYIVTDRWQRFTEVKITKELIIQLTEYCDEFLIHAVDVEGKSNGIELELISILGTIEGFPITYAGGISSFADLKELKRLGNNRLDVTIGSSLDLFGGNMKFQDVIKFMSNC
ncbi:phosphoribosylformimino-5-aminoimidazole carboxamide ribotide isomerase [Lachnospiraceae bacterium KM106-2]|nr:phosphoribosylformimino-5-aminoimidazole carboxamide ribotide isomerase [Lachnospiraceae bacterium KM106-2]